MKTKLAPILGALAVQLMAVSSSQTPLPVTCFVAVTAIAALAVLRFGPGRAAETRATGPG